tara:strand:+ start:362 stop:763 length:402 start_codon:yes stop_codon:yes gene_type:complete
MALVSVLALGGCGTLQPKPPEEVIADRALAQARHLINRDYDSALTYVVPSYQSGARAKFYEAEFVGSASWIDASVRWVKCDEAPQADRCKVRLWIYGSLPSAAGYNSARGDDVPWSWNTVWVKIDGEWYQYLD